jgi:2-succinyl-6-hydroxy-2,4-cyclohexadiene-1-carboxylate synthase
MAPLLLIHGFAGAPEDFDAVCARLGDPKVLTPTLSGHGDPPALSNDFEQEVERLHQLLLAFSGPPVVGVGYSLGARLLLGMLVRFPQSFQAATLIGVNPGLRVQAERQERRAWEAEMTRLMDLGLDAFIDHWETLPLFASQRLLPAEALSAQRRRRLSHTAGGLKHAMRTLGLSQMPSYWDCLGTLDVPIQLVVGERDPKFIGISEKMTRKLQDAELCVAQGVGHNVVLEAPLFVAEQISKRTEP